MVMACRLFARRAFSTSFCVRASLQAPTSTRTNTLDEEVYGPDHLKAYYSAHPGQVFKNKYVITSKLGFGKYSTVWLAQDLQANKNDSDANVYVALKIGICKSSSHVQPPQWDMRITKRVSKHNPKDIRFDFFRSILDEFEVSSGIGEDGEPRTHQVFVHAALGDSVYNIVRYFANKKGAMGIGALKWYARNVLGALDYLHTVCKVVHSDLREQHILTSVKTKSLENFIADQTSDPLVRKTVDLEGGRQYTIYEAKSIAAYQIEDETAIAPVIIDLDFAMSQTEDPTATGKFGGMTRWPSYQSPEAILGVEWLYAVDIWSFGVTLWEWFTLEELFKRHFRDPEGHITYDPAAHFAEMIGLLGPPPRELVDLHLEAIRWKPVPGSNLPSDHPKFTLERYKHEYFDQKGNFLFPNRVPTDISLESAIDTTFGQDDVEKREFLRFLRRMLTWHPEERATARQLLEDPWMDLTEFELPNLWSESVPYDEASWESMDPESLIPK